MAGGPNADPNKKGGTVRFVRSAPAATAPAPAQGNQPGTGKVGPGTKVPPTPTAQAKAPAPLPAAARPAAAAGPAKPAPASVSGRAPLSQAGMRVQRKRLGELLREANVIEEDQLEHGRVAGMGDSSR